jgi:hypothetical protein
MGYLRVVAAGEAYATGRMAELLPLPGPRPALLEGGW